MGGTFRWAIRVQKDGKTNKPGTGYRRVCASVRLVREERNSKAIFKEKTCLGTTCQPLPHTAEHIKGLCLSSALLWGREERDELPLTPPRRWGQAPPQLHVQIYSPRLSQMEPPRGNAPQISQDGLTAHPQPLRHQDPPTSCEISATSPSRLGVNELRARLAHLQLLSTAPPPSTCPIKLTAPGWL